MTTAPTVTTATRPAATKPPAPQVSDDEIDAAIMKACERAWGKDRQVVAWASIRNRVPGGVAQICERLLALHYAGRIYLYKFGGRNYLATPIPGPVVEPGCYD